MMTRADSIAEQRVAVACGAGAIVIGTAGLAGWALGNTFLLRVSADHKAIAPVVAACLVVLGVVLYRRAADRMRRGERIVSAALAAIVAVIGLLEVIGAVIGRDLNMEDALTAHLQPLMATPFETMSPIAGLLLFLLGTALIALLAQSPTSSRAYCRPTASSLSMIAAATALVFAMGYLHGSPLLYGRPILPIAIWATVGGLLLGIGVMAISGRECWPLSSFAGDSARAQLLRAFVPLVALAVFAMSVAHERIPLFQSANHVFAASMLAVAFAVAVAWVASRVAVSIGSFLDAARLAEQAAAEALRQSEARLKRGEEIAQLGSWELDLVHNYLTWSDEVYRIFGLQPQQFAATYEAFLAAVHPEDRGAVDAAYSGSVREGRDEYEIEHRVVRSTGEVRIVHEKCQHLRDASGRIVRSVGMVHDITARREAEQAIAEQAHLLETIVENTDAQLVYLDRDFNFIWVNSEYARSCGRPRESFVGRNHFELYPHAENEAIFRRVRDTGEPARYVEKPFEFPDMPERGVTYWDWTLTPINTGAGEVESMIFSLADVTERVRARERLLEAERARTQMAETVAVEINHRTKNNLMVVSGILELQIAAHGENPEVVEELRDAQTRIHALATVHERMYEQRADRVELMDVLRRIAEPAVAAFGGDEVNFSISGDQVWSSSRAASSLAVVSNELITNAFKHGAPGADGKRRVEVTLAKLDGKIRLRVRGSGNPVPPEFDARQASGLGLALCRELVEGDLRGDFVLRAEPAGTVGEVVIPEQSLQPREAALPTA
jgi:PAS domain S-box-containing protein